jgi:hypothetical protein
MEAENLDTSYQLFLQEFIKDDQSQLDLSLEFDSKSDTSDNPTNDVEKSTLWDNPLVVLEQGCED